MRVAAIYDIHGNLPALEAVLADVRRAGVDLVVVGGDVVPGPMPRETIARLLDAGLPMQFIHGNGDRETLGILRGGETTLPEPFRTLMHWTASTLGPEYEPVFASWPTTISVDIDGLGTVLFCHATPRNDTEIFTRNTPGEQLSPAFAGVDASVVVCGHTHMQFDRAVGRTRIVNAGSVGMPFGSPGAYWLLLGPGVEHRHTAYDLASAAARIRATAYPQADDFADHNVLQPPSEQDVLARFAHAELK